MQHHPAFHLDANYEALSYSAGYPTETGEIVVNGHLFNVFAMLFSAMKRLRFADKGRILWID
jgi:hypothetical protein